MKTEEELMQDFIERALDKDCSSNEILNAGICPVFKISFIFDREMSWKSQSAPTGQHSITTWMIFVFCA